MEKPKIGIVTLLHPQRPLPEAESLSRQAATAIAQRRFRGWCTPARPGMRTKRATGACSSWKHGWIWPSSSSAPGCPKISHSPWTGRWAILRACFGRPPFIAGDPRTPSYTLTGLTATASNLRHCGRRFVHHVGGVDPESIARVARAARVAYLLRLITRSRFGMVSAPCPGMIDVSGDNMPLICALGVRLVHLDLHEVFAGTESVSQVEVKRVIRGLKEKVGKVEASDEDLAEAVKNIPGAQGYARPSSPGQPVRAVLAGVPPANAPRAVPGPGAAGR